LCELGVRFRSACVAADAVVAKRQHGWFLTSQQLLCRFANTVCGLIAVACLPQRVSADVHVRTGNPSGVRVILMLERQQRLDASLVLALLCALAPLAMRFGYDSRDLLRSEEHEFARHRVAWGRRYLSTKPRGVTTNLNPTTEFCRGLIRRLDYAAGQYQQPADGDRFILPKNRTDRTQAQHVEAIHSGRGTASPDACR
jgi:hypothetical protein